MSEAIYALAGTLLGSLGGFLAAWLNIRAQDRRAEDEALIRTCLAFVARIMGVRRLCLQMEQAGFQEEWWNEAQALLGEAEGDLEHLKLITDHEATQVAARYTVHHAYWLTRAAAGRPHKGSPVDWKEQHDGLRKWLHQFHVLSRAEIGKKRPAAVFADKLGGDPQPNPMPDSAL